MLIQSRMDQLLESFIKDGPAGCACRISQNNNVIYEGYFGYSNLEQQLPITPDTIYRIYSMTKVIASVALLTLLERGVFLLDDPLYEYFPEFRDSKVFRRKTNGMLFVSPAAQPIRIRHLLTMTSGITNPGNETETAKGLKSAIQKLKENETRSGHKADVRAMTRAIASVPLAFDPGTHWKYGSGYDVLGALIEVLSGKKFGQFLQDEIFEPLGMKDTFFRIPENKKQRLCSFYRYGGRNNLTEILDMDEDYQPDAVMESGCGGLLSTLDDYSKFAQMLVNGGMLNGVRIIGHKTIELMATNHLTPLQMAENDWPHLKGYGYGLGVRVMVDPTAGGSNGSIGEFGWMGMAGSWLLVDRKEHLSAVYMQQLRPSRIERQEHRLRAVIYGAL